MRELIVAWTGRARAGPWEELSGEYRGRIAHFVPVRDLPLRPAPGEGAERLAAEAASLRRALPSPCRLVALDRRGRALSSPAFAEWLQAQREGWPHALAFALGSDLGLDETLRGEAALALSLGPLTLPHQLARLVLYEQLYRALSLAAGMKYHRAPL
jgi:23S rRNA (pseudouridine1915-N3)-methyltransferase